MNRTGSCLFGKLVPSQAFTVLHIDHVTVFGEPIDKGGGKVIVLEKRPPLTKPQIRSDEGRLLLVPLLHECKEEPHLHRFHFHIAHLIDKKAVH